ncbi:hypothetical protein IQ215_04830 [Cyanobacterium stanieri LEGE 03274]|uniref:Uncharacterized protein n=1 Tax=Cyanobacterium stanieri LEGE 03274 TaxID=1828756 RepID=A0ABR9V2A9_9CHRO|nr:hypothetical protein [Cyanobacterium stanieri]MBE9222017.1 hypothetical protein [Cyanobacterium stanieri LEGE 03274]
MIKERDKYAIFLGIFIVLGAIAQRYSLMLPQFWDVTITALTSFYLGYLIKKSIAK